MPSVDALNLKRGGQSQQRLPRPTVKLAASGLICHWVLQQTRDSSEIQTRESCRGLQQVLALKVVQLEQATFSSEGRPMKTLFALSATTLLAIALTSSVEAQIITTYRPTVTYYTAPTVAYAAPVATTAYYAPAATTAYYAPTSSCCGGGTVAPVTTYYAPTAVAAPVTTYYAPAAPVTAYYAPATTVYSPVVAPVTAYYPVGRPGLFGRRWRAWNNAVTIQPY